MRKWKKVITVFLCVAVLSLLAGCSFSTEKKENTETSKKAQKEETETSSTDNKTDTNGKTLVVYYSASGNTKDAAEAIADAADADIFQIEPKEAYSDADLDWTDDNSRVSREYANEDERDVELVSSKVKNWKSYDTVFIGYPIWWGIAAWPADSFVKANDFDGKTVIPFCTSSSSGLGDSGKLLKETAGSGDWQEGKRFSSGVSKEDVQAWVEELGLKKE